MKRHLLLFCAAALVPTTARAQGPTPDASPVDPGTEPSGNDENTADESPVEAALPEATPPQAPAQAPEIQMPRVLQEAPFEYPSAAEGSGNVVLLVTVAADGTVEKAEIAEGINQPIDEAVVASVRLWTFEPAKRDGEPIAAKIRLNFAVSAPPPPPQPFPEAAVPADSEPTQPPVHEHEPSDDAHLQVTVHGERSLRTETRGSGDYAIHREVLDAAPHAEGAEALRVAPGLAMFRTEGMAQAHSYSLRGFDAEHGQDIEFVVGGLPINLPSHIHGQGYSDLGFLIGEVVDEVSVNEGVSDPRQGDFAVAGTLRVGLGIDEGHRGLQVRGGYGAFNTPSVHLVWAPKESERESFGAAQYTATEGFGENRAGQSASGIVQHRFGSGDITYRTIGFVHGARGDSAGVLRQEDIDSGEVCYHCVYDTPTATAQNGLSQRLMAGAFADYHGPEHANGTIGFYVGRDHYRSQSNYTGYLESSQTLPGVSGRGDLIEQSNDTTTWGLTGRYRTEAFDAGRVGHGTLEVGLDGRFDQIDQTQNLLDASVRNQTWDERVEARIQALGAGIWGDLDWQFSDRVLARAGVRGAVNSYDVNDQLGNYAPQTRPQDQFLPGYRRSSMGASIGPRTSIEVRVTDWLRLLSSYGEGYRSPQARTLSDGETAPFAKVRAADAGFRTILGSTFDATLSGYYTHLSDDVVFDASEGRLESIGPTQRMGAVVATTLRPVDWMLASASVTYVNTALLEPPPATAEEPDPPFEKGQPLPFVSPLVMRLDASVRRNLLELRDGKPLVGRWGLGFSYLAARPLPYNTQGEAIPLLDASMGLIWGKFDLNVSGFNLLNLNYAAREYMFVSHWDPNSPPSRLPARHISAGAPLNIMATLGVNL